MTLPPWTQVLVEQLTTFGLNRAIRETFSTVGLPAPEQLVFMRSGTAG